MSSVFEPSRFGSFFLTARLGRGGMAEVFRAQQTGAAGFVRTVVVKRILGTHQQDPSFVQMFINEAKIAARLTHPNIVQVHELGQVEGEFFMCMEYVKGRDLLRVLRELAHTNPRSCAIPERAAAFVAREICRGLAHAHEHTDEQGKPLPIIHRDVSPQNIMLGYDGQVKLVDFGIAKAVDSMREETRSGALKGKFAYMAPELIGGVAPGPQSDVFSVGVVLHEMLTGRRLFKGATDFDTLSKVKSMLIPPPSSINGAVSPELDRIVAQALARDRAQRYPRASAMARDLDEVLQTQRFAVEDMADFMGEVFPPEKRDEPPEPKASASTTYVVTPGPGSASGSVTDREMTTPGTPRARADTGSSSARMGRGGGRGRALAGAILLAGGVAGLALLVPFGRGGEDLESREGPELVGPAAPAGPAGPEDRQGQGPPPAEVVVRVISEPPGAQVFDGPRLVGVAPVSLRLAADSPGVTLTLVREGRQDLSYTVQASDSPELTLRLERPPLIEAEVAPAAPTSSRAPLRPRQPEPSRRPAPSRPQLPAEPKVEIFEDAPEEVPGAEPQAEPQAEPIEP